MFYIVQIDDTDIFVQHLVNDSTTLRRSYISCQTNGGYVELLTELELIIYVDRNNFQLVRHIGDQIH